MGFFENKLIMLILIDKKWLKGLLNMDYKLFVKEILKNIGMKSNVRSIIYCVMWVWFVLNDEL